MSREIRGGHGQPMSWVMFGPTGNRRMSIREITHRNFCPTLVTFKPRLHDTTNGQTGCQIGFTTG